MSQIVSRCMKRLPNLRNIHNFHRFTPNFHYLQCSHSSTTESLDLDKPSTFVVGIDGTSYGYLALEHTFRIANINDNIIGLHIPLDLYQFAYEQLVFSVGVSITQEQRDKFHEKRSQFINQIETKTNEIINKYNKNNIKFKFVVHDDSVAVKYDLVDAVDELKCDYLVLGSKGHSHSIKEAVMFIFIHLYL